MATTTKQSPPIRRKDVWDFRPWKSGDLRRPSTGSAASDVYPHLRSAAAERPEIDNTKSKEKGRAR
jgi:hypothetical protein